MALDVLRLSTSSFPEGDRDEVIREYYGKIAQRMEIEPAAGRPFHMDVAAMRLPGVMVGHGTVSALAGSRTAAMRCDGASDIILSFQKQGAVLREGERETVVRPGDVSLTALDRPTTLFMSEERNRFLTVQISRASLAPLLANVDDLLRGSLQIGRPGLRLLEAYASSLSPEDLQDPDVQMLAARHLVELAVIALASTPDGVRKAGAGGLRAARREAAKAIVMKAIDSPHLSAAWVAARLGVTPRYLHKLFEDQPQTFARFVTDTRLARAMRALSDPLQRDRRIVDIALQAGFGDVTTFNRAFRRRFGKSPSECRP
ncbi:AraC family transcriptional regulator [Phenylobacterium kunshanense]|uniref:HTH araC/xylS-type domain-containing protein n=1 Tax=Phenylobacterium kunshanense TaxID=1445034 RepID=A0A328BL74_9CAUL|nr:AraC family transcriptional regulator [Phenylobacterium kunshanense]RAK67191.1 hypothetical protein DJ019_04440 [Phenylobacterium kunshanense]